MVPVEVAKKHVLVPISRMGNIICIAKPNYFNRASVQEIRKLTGLKVKVFQADEGQVRASIDKLYEGKPGDIPAPVTKLVAAVPIRAPKVEAPKPTPAPVPTAPRRTAPPPPIAEESEAVPLFSQMTDDEVAAPRAAAPSGNGDDVIEILKALKMTSQEFATAKDRPLNRLISEFDDLFKSGRAVPAQRG